MSASSKKKLRKEQAAAILTEKQRREQAEAKKLKAYSITFIAIMLVVAITAVSVMGVTVFNRTGILQKNTVAATVNGENFNSVQLSYYFHNIVNSTYNNWHSEYQDSTNLMLAFMGLDVSKPLDEQQHPDGDSTWADYFMEMALERLKSDYVLSEKAKAEGITLSEDTKKAIDTDIENIEIYAMLTNASSADDYLVSMYGYGANEKSYREYCERGYLASAYYNQYAESLEYDDAAIRAYEEGKYDEYSSFNYASYFVSRGSYLPEGTKDADGNTTYTAEQYEAARAAAEKAAQALLSNKTVAAFDNAISAMDINAEAESPVTSSKITDKMYGSVDKEFREWVASSDRKEGDIQMFPYEVTSTGADGKETTSINGYFVVMFQSRNDHTRKLANVRHLLVKFVADSNGNVSDDNKEAAKTEAEGYLKTWKEGAATEDSFIELVKANSDDATASTGGLISNISLEKGVYVEPFYNWCVDASRKTGDAEVIETEFGYHVMYYVGDGEQTYRDVLIIKDMKTEAIEAWNEKLMEGVSFTKGNTSRVETGIILYADTSESHEGHDH